MRRSRKVKILATLGPASSDKAVIAALFQAGADVFRINMSHTAHDKLRELVASIRAISAEQGRPIGILADLQGPKLRVGTFANGPETLVEGARRLADVLLDLYPVSGRRAADLRSWARSPEAGELRIAEINRVDGVHEALEDMARFHPSEYFANVRPGCHVAGLRHETLMGLSYEDERFDLVLTSETLEHVPDLTTALAEIRRVLVPGGRHVFTVPVTPIFPQTFPRARLDGDGSIEDLAHPIKHPGGDVGYRVFTELGLDFPAILERAGFETEVRFGPVSDDDLGQVYVCRKPG